MADRRGAGEAWVRVQLHTTRMRAVVAPVLSSPAASEPACLLPPCPPSACSCSVHNHRLFHGAYGTVLRLLQQLELARALLHA